MRRQVWRAHRDAAARRGHGSHHARRWPLHRRGHIYAPFGEFRDTWHHESWHQLEARVLPGSLEQFYEALRPWAFGAANPYTVAPCERLANAYATFACQSDLIYGGTGEHIPVPTGGDDSYVYEVFSALCSGRYARVMRARGLL